MKRLPTLVPGLALALGLTCSGCADQVLTNVVAGLQDGAITTTTGLINAFFELRFPTASFTQGNGSGDDLFVQL